MATRKPSRSEWQLKSGKWTRSLGSRGARVRLFQKRRGGCSTARSGCRRAEWIGNVSELLIELRPRDWGKLFWVHS